MFVTPAVAGDLVYVGSCSGVYYAFDLASGEARWQHDFKRDLGHATFHGDPWITDRLVITPTESLQPTHARAFDRRTGRTVWQQSGEWAFTDSDLLGLEGLVVGRNEDGELIALVTDSGEPAWRVRHGGGRFRSDVAESPARVDGDVIFSAPDGAVYRVRGADGTILWRTEVGCDVSTSVTVWSGGIYLGCSDGEMFRLDPADGDVSGRLALKRPLQGRLLGASDRLVVPGGRDWIGAADPDLTGVLWERTDLPRLSVVQPLRWGNAVLTGARDTLFALALEDGRTLWSTPLEGAIRGLGTEGEILLVGTIEGRIYALRGLP